MNLTFQYKLNLTTKQIKIFDTILEGQRILYNAALQERNDAYKKKNISITKFDQYQHLPSIKQDVPVNIQRWTLTKLDNAYKAFFNRVKSNPKKAGFPRYRSKDVWKSFGFNEFAGITLKNNILKFNKMTFKLKMHRDISSDYKITGCVFTKDEFGWKVNIGVKYVSPEKRPIVNTIGLDMGLTHLVTLSTGEQIDNIRTTKKYEKKLKVKQRQLSRCMKTSNRRKKIKLSIARIHRKIKNTRDTYLHQMSNKLVNDYDLIAVEDLNIKSMISQNRFNKSIHDASWNKLIYFLCYKAERAGSTLIKVNPKNTSQACSGCGVLVKKEISVRIHNCSDCGLVMDRDHNAAINILDRAVVSPEFVNVNQQIMH